MPAASTRSSNSKPSSDPPARDAEHVVEVKDRRHALSIRDRPRHRGPDAHRARDRTPDHRHPADRQRELHLAGRDARRRFRADQQVLRGLPRQALLRRQQRGRLDRTAGDRPGEGAVRRRARQRAAPLGRQRQHVRLPGVVAARRHRARAEPPRRRPPHTRLAGERQRPALQLRVVRRRGRGPDRDRQRPRARPRAPPEDDRRRHDELPAPPRARTVPSDRRRGRRAC